MRISPSHWLGGPPTWDWIDREIILAWRRFEATQVCPCGTPWAVHETQTARDFAAGELTCPAAESVSRARAAYAKSPAGEAEAERVRGGEANPAEWRYPVHWPAALPPPSYPPLD